MGLSEDYFVYPKQTSTLPERSTLADLFHVYAPDLESDVRRVLDIRGTQLQILTEGLDQGGVPNIQEAVNALCPEVPEYRGRPGDGPSSYYINRSVYWAADVPRWEGVILVREAPGDDPAQHIARAFEHSAWQLNQLSKTLSSYIKQNWNVKEQTLGK
jgi:hypothetical protein